MLISLTSASVVVGDLDVVGIAVAEAEADAPLVVDRDRVLVFAIAFQRMQAVARRHTEIVETALQVRYRDCVCAWAKDLMTQAA